MPSVGLTWRGSCLPSQQEELLWFLSRLADANDELLKADSLPPDEFVMFDPDFMTPERKERLRSRPNVDRIDRDIAETIEVDSSIFPEYREFQDGAEQLGLPIIGAGGPAVEEGAFVLNPSTPTSRRAVQLKKCSIYGINFKVFGVGYPWYPGEDRVSFVFLHCPDILFLDGRIVDIFHRSQIPGLIRFNTIQNANWYAQVPQIHLRYYLESWFDYFFSWAKFFFIPNLHWWRHDDLPSYDRYRFEFEDLRAKVGTTLAKRAIFDDILAAFMSEAECWTDRSRVKRSPPDFGSGVQGRVLRILRQSGEADLD